MIVSIYLQNVQIAKYRSCRSTKFNPDPHLSALIGANGSGKSNLLQSVLLLKKAMRVARHRVEEDLTLSACKLGVTFSIDEKELPYEALIKYTSSERNIDSVVTAVEKWNFREFTGKDEWIHVPLSLAFEYVYFSPTHELSERDRLEFMQRRYSHIAREKVTIPSVRKMFNVLSKVEQFIGGMTYYSASQFTDPSRCPASFEIESDRLPTRELKQGSEHLQFMHDLYSAYKDNRTEFEEFRSIVGIDGVKLVDSIRYDEINIPSSIYQVVSAGKIIQKEIKKLLVIPNFVVRGSRLSPSQLSEGTFKTLAVVFYLITDKSRLLLLEEPEVCIHHGLLSSIIEIIKSFSRKKQIIISTHSDFVLDALEPENVFLVTNDRQKGTQIRHVPDAMSTRKYASLKDYLQKYGNLGEYWRHGELEQ
jgi:ABC-type branched-subunit amino acid transport system ATPase component